MLDDISKLADSLYQTSWELNKRWPHDNPDIEYEVDKRNELQCLALYDEGWRPDGFEYITNSYDIITYWKKDGSRPGENKMTDITQGKTDWHSTTTDSTIITPYTLSPTTANISYPASNIDSGSISVSPFGSGTATWVTTESAKCCVFRLPESAMPNKVYVAGRLVTVGILGSDVQAAYAGGNKLIFMPNELDSIVNGRRTVSLDYGDFLYHYNIDQGEFGAVEFEKDTTILKVKLISKAAQR